MICNTCKRASSITALAVLLGLLFAGCTSTSSKKDGAKAEGEETVKPRVSSYIRTWAVPPEMRNGDNAYWSADMIKGEYLTDLIISFALIDQSDGSSIYIPEIRDETPGFFNLWDEVAAVKAKYPHIKVNISVGGYNAEGFSDMANDENLKAAFIVNICRWLEQYNLDGIDIDWEYPVGPEWGLPIKTRPEDRDNYISLLRDIRKALDTLGAKTGKRYGLSTAVPASGWFNKANDAAAAADIVDALKLMAYDYYGSWSKTTGHNANLFNNPADPDGWSTQQALDLYLEAGIPADKIMLGCPFYAHAWQGVEAGETNGLFQPYTSLPFGEDGTISYSLIKEMLKPDSGYTRYWDPIAEAPFLYNGDILISYTDEEGIRILNKFAKEKGLAGVFVWEYIHDKDADLLKVLAESAE